MIINDSSLVSCMDYSVFNGDLSAFSFSNKTLINTINQYSYCVAENDTQFKKALQESDILLPDGVGIVAAVKLLNNKSIRKIAGADIHEYLLKDLNKKGGRCFYLGSSEGTLLKIKEQISKEFPNIQLDFYSPPFKNEFSENDNTAMIDRINLFKPDALFIGMTAPKQEKWVHQFKNQLDVKVICSIGAVFDFYAGTVKRPGKFWINMGLEWFVRLLKEPKRMKKRYLYYGPIFLKLIVLEKIRKAFS